MTEEELAAHWEAKCRTKAHYARGLELRMSKALEILWKLPKTIEVDKAIKALEGIKQ